MKYLVYSLILLLHLTCAPPDTSVVTDVEEKPEQKDATPIATEPIKLVGDDLMGGWTSQCYARYLQERRRQLDRIPFETSDSCPLHALFFLPTTGPQMTVLFPFTLDGMTVDSTVLDLSIDSLYTLGQRLALKFEEEEHYGYLTMQEGQILSLIVPSLAPYSFTYEKVLSYAPSKRLPGGETLLLCTLLKTEQSFIAGTYRVYNAQEEVIAENVVFSPDGKLSNWDDWEAFYLKMSERGLHNLILLESSDALEVEQWMLMGGVENEQVLMLEKDGDKINVFSTHYRANTPSYDWWKRDLIYILDPV